MRKDLLIIDGLQYANWSPEIFGQMREGRVSAVHATICYHENFRETAGEFNRLASAVRTLPRCYFPRPDGAGRAPCAGRRSNGDFPGFPELLADRG